MKLRKYMYGTVLAEKERTKDIEQEQQPTQFRVRANGIQRHLTTYVHIADWVVQPTSKSPTFI